jgi:thermitase
MATKKKIITLAAKMFLTASFTLSLISCGDRNLSIVPDEIESATINSIPENSIAGQVIVKFKQQVSIAAVENFAQQSNARLIKYSSRLNIALLGYQPGEEASQIPVLQTNPLVEYAEQDLKFTNTYTVSDPHSKEQSGLAVANVHKAWDITFGDPRIIIAVVDTGVDMNHPDLKNKLVPGYNVLTDGTTPPKDDNGHGTHASGIAAAETNNKVGIAGTCPNCKIMPVKVLDMTGGNSSLVDIAIGIVWAVDHGARVISLSLGGPENETIKRAVQYALMKNAVVVVAMGNDGENPKKKYGNIKSFPAAIPGVISVGSVDLDRSKSSFSNWGEWISVVAPGRGIYSTMPTYEVTKTQMDYNNNYDFMDGTSMACPMVAGIAGLVLSRNPQYTPAEVKERIESTATDLGTAGFDTKYGHGLVNAGRAVL